MFFGKGSLLGHDPKSLELEAYNKASFQLNMIYSSWFAWDNAGTMLEYIVVFAYNLVIVLTRDFTPE